MEYKLPRHSSHLVKYSTNLYKESPHFESFILINKAGVLRPPCSIMSFLFSFFLSTKTWWFPIGLHQQQ